MAKTASQIQKERKAVSDYRNAVHEQQMAGVAEKAAARTLAVLNKAISGTSDSTKKSELSRAAQMVTAEYKKASSQKKSEPNKAVVMQKKKEDQADEKYQFDSLQTKKNQAQKALDDFDNNKEIDWTDTNQRKAYDAERKQLQDEVDRAGAEIDARKDAATHDANMERIASMNAEDREQLQQYVESRDARRSVFANPISWYQDYNKETENKNALIDKYGEEELAKLAETYSRHLHEQSAKKTVEDTQESVNQNWIAAALHNIAAVPARAMGGIEAMAGRLYEQADRTGQYRTLEENTAGDTLSLYGNAVSGQTAQNIAGENGNVVRGALSIGYQGAMSVVDSIARTFFGGGATGGAALAATNSFTQTVSEATKQGASPQQAVTLGVGKAGIEYLTEKYSIDEVFKFAKAGDANVWKSAFKQVGVEITTEEATLFGSLALEAAVLRGKSSYKQKIGELVANGKSYEEAKAQADNDVWNEALQTAAVSGFAGFISGGGAALVGNLNTDSAPEVTAEATSEVPAQAVPAAPVVDEGQQIVDEVTAEPSTAPLVDGIQDMTPAPEPLTQEQQQLNVAASLTLDEVLGKMNSKENGATNSMANAVLNDPVALEQLVQLTMAEITGTKAEQRKAVKEALNRMFSSEVSESVDTASVAEYDNINTSQEGVTDYVTRTENDNGGNGWNTEVNSGILSSQGPANSDRDVRPGDSGRISGGNGEGTLRVADSEGRELTPEISERIIGTAVADGDGRPLAVYHFTDNMDFDVFSKGDTGFHFGSVEQANNRAVDKKAAAGRTFRAYLDIRNPIRVDTDIMGWHPGGTALKLWGMGILTDAEKDLVISTYRMGDGYDSESAVTLRQILEQKGYDGIVYPNAHEGTGDSYMAFRDNQIIRSEIRPYGESAPDVDTYEAAQMGASNIQQQSTNGTQVKGTGAAEQNFSGKAEYQNLLSEDNVQRDRKGDVRPMEVPKTDSFGRRVSELVGNAYGAEITTDKMANTIEELVQEGALGFDVRHNQDSMNTAAEQIAQRGVAATRKQITNAVASGKIRDGDVEQAILLYAMYNSKDTPTAIDNASEILVDLATMANITGRNLQMFRLLRKMTPEGQVTTIRKTVQSNIDSMIKSGAVKKGYTTEIDPELLAEYRKAAGENMRAVSEEQKKASAEKMKTIMDAIYAMEAAKMPATMKAKWDAWRYMAMLGNAKTQVRNIAGNLAFKPYKEVKDKMGALAEKVFVSKDQRTKSLFTDQSLVKWARQDAKTVDVHDALKYSAKLGDDVSTQKIRDNMQVFNNKALDSVRKFVESVPSSGDMLFKNNYYVRSLAGFLKARGYKATDIQSGKVSDTILAEARAYAIQEAMKATFNDSNAFSDFMATGLRYKGDNPFGKALNIAAEGVLPFRRTPANIAVRFSEYSPVGIAKGLWSAATKVRNGEMTAATAIDQLTSGLTGSAVMALGFALAGGMNGIKITGSGADEDEKRQGHQDYALEFSVDGQEYSYKIDWAAPANLPLFVGANIYSVLENAGENTDVSKFTSFIRGMGTAFEPMLALSCMSGLNNLLESARYADEGEVLYSIVAEAATGYFTQGIPALVRQAYQATQENKQTTFTKSDDPTIRDLQLTAASVPFAGAEYQTDKRNAWGEKESQGDWMTRAFNSFVNPGTLKKIDNSAAELEISRLNKAGYNVTPNTAARTVSYTDKDGTDHDDVRLTEEQFQKLAETQGQTARKLLDDMISSASYDALTDEQKADAIDTAYLYARKTAEIAAIEDHTGYDQSWFYDVEKGGAEEIIRRVLNSGLNTSMSDLDTAWDRGYNEETFNRELETAYESYRNAPAEMRKQVYAEAEGTAKKYIEARDKGVSHEDFVTAAENIAKVKGTGKGGTVRNVDRRQAIANTAGMTEKEIDIVMKAYMADYDPNDESPETTEMKYDYIRHEMGMSAKEYAATYRAYLDNGKKAQRIAAIRALGYDYGTALKLYKVYYGSMKKELIDMYG